MAWRSKVNAITIHSPIPSSDFTSKVLKIGNSPAPKTLPGKDSDLDFRLIQPTSVRGCVVDRKSVPDLAANLLTKCVHQRFAPMDVQVVHDEMDGVGLRVLHRHFTSCQSKLKPGAVRCGMSEMAAGFGLY